MADDAVHIKAAREDLSIVLQSLIIFICDDYVTAIRAGEDVPISQEGTKHVSLIFCQCRLLAITCTAPTIDENQLIAYSQFIGTLFDNGVIRLVVHKVDMLRRGAQQSIFCFNS